MEIVIIGGVCWIKLSKAIVKSKDIRVTLVDKNNYNFFPIIYQVATVLLNHQVLVILLENFFGKKKSSI
jgi:NADH dehydrogenase